MFFQKIKKLTIGFVLSVLIFSSVVGFFISAEPANAQGPVLISGDIPRQASAIKDMIKNGWKIAVLNAAQQAVSYFLRKVAYDTAMYIASGNKGQGAFVQSKGFGDYLASAGSEAAGTAIEQLGKGFGLDLCKIPDVKIDLALRIGLHYNYALGSQPRKPACNLTTFAQNWGSDAWASKYGGGSGPGGFDVNKVFNKTLVVDDAPMGVVLKTTEKIDRLVVRQTNAAQADREEGAGFKPATRLVSGDIKTPSQTIKKQAEDNSPSEQNKKSQAQVAAAMGSGAYEILPSTLSLFLNTLAGQMLKNFKENGMLPGGLCVGSFGGPDCKGGQGSQATNFEAGTSVSGRAAAEATFSDFLTIKLDTLSTYDILAELNSCESHGLYNCRADGGIILALQQAKQEDPFTIQEAMDKGWLKREWKLIPPSRVADNQIGNDADKNCYNNNYCYSNLQVLRQLRIFPLGMEIAAKNSDPDRPWTLKEVVDGFYKCNYEKTPDGTVVGINYDPENYPLCHLVDPNWVIKLEQTRCDAKAYSSVPLSADVPDRVNECVDLKTCIGVDKDKNCVGYGNCVREKNVWKFDAKSCDARNVTCRAFTDSAGKSVAYLYRTLDTGDCNQDTAGCTAYSLEQDNAGWEPLAKTGYGSYSTGIYLNKNVSTACSANSAGCTALKLPVDTDPNQNNFYPIKKAPDYLNCYDKNADRTDGIQWPKTFSDIYQLKPRPECRDYAQVCIADEVGCATYKLADDPEALPIPGKFTPTETASGVLQNWNDQCNQKCAGYAAYREMPSNYSAGNPLAYIIPPSKYNNGESGATCGEDEVGCSSFTNMATTEGGGEKVENFTDLRACIKPDVNKQKNFYTYEGSTLGGYQLQSYTLEKDVDGGPKTVFNTPQDKIDAGLYKCNADLYKLHQEDTECHQFNDDRGNIYYAMMSHTIVVSTDCTPYRLNSTELAGPKQCFNNGEYNEKDGACYYNGLPSGVKVSTQNSVSCDAKVVSCRAYKGNNGNNIKTVNIAGNNPVETFENQSDVTAANGWRTTDGNINWSAESTRAGEHSLGYVGGGKVYQTVDLKHDSLDLQGNTSYSLSFWAKGNGVNVDVSMTDVKNNIVTAGTITANTSWQQFTFNLVELQSSGTSTINFKLNKSGNLFLDNIRLTKVSDLLYLVKDSLKVDPICDDNQTDNLPGVALGCNAYEGPLNSNGDNLFFLTNFSFLCREGAIGCTAFMDTYNKITDSGPRAYNVSLIGKTGTEVIAQIGGDSYKCQIEQGKTSCFVNVKGHTKDEIEKATGAKAEFGNSTYYIPADTDSADPIYLVAKNDQVDYTCNSADLGCTYAGMQKSTPSGDQFTTTTIKLDPAQLETGGSDASGNPLPVILCQQQALGCGVFGSSLGDAYFKDPAVIGAKICAYNPSVTKNNNKVSGWFWKGVGVCGNTSKTCSEDSDCTDPKSNTCIDKDVQPCYPDYLQNGNSYGLWSYGNKDKYNNFVGECPAEEDACTEFVDRNDNDKSYPFIKDSKISEGDCGGMVSQKAGCAIFDQTDNPNKFWNTAATYRLSDNSAPGQFRDMSKGTKVQPQNMGDKNNANVIIKVKRDRECAEWLQCRSPHPVIDESSGVWKQSCQMIGRCNKLETGVGSDSSMCGNFNDNKHEFSNQILTEKLYQTRDVSWEGMDLSGFSVLNTYPLEEMTQVNIGSGSSENWVLAKTVPCGGNNCAYASQPKLFVCKDDKLPCGASKEGKCINGNCIKNIAENEEKNQAQQTSVVVTDFIGDSCRAYPEKDSPFPNIPSVGQSKNFSTVNICSEGNKTSGTDAYKCECDYLKVTYQSIIKYFNLDNPNSVKPISGSESGKAPVGICLGGDSNGAKCASDSECLNKSGNPDGSCQMQDRESKVIGWHGFCIEQDKSRAVNADNSQYPCLTWYPVDNVLGTPDINGNHVEAGYVPPDKTDPFYCLQANMYVQPKVFRVCKKSPDLVCDNESCADKYKTTYDSNNKVVYNPCPEGYHTGVNNGVYRIDCGNPSDDPDVMTDCTSGGWSTNGCNIRCELDSPSDDLWILKSKYAVKGLVDYAYKSSLYKQQAVACSFVVEMKDSIAYTNRLWEKSGYTIDASTTAYQNKLNYKFDSSKAPFGYAANPGNKFLPVPWCSSPSSDVFAMPKSDNGCENNYLPSDNDNFGRPYSGWQFGSNGSACATSADCNQQVNCGNKSKCMRQCTTDSDCVGMEIPTDSSGSPIFPPKKPSCNLSTHYCYGIAVSVGPVDPCLSSVGEQLENATCGEKNKLNFCVGTCGNNSNQTCATTEDCYAQLCSNGSCLNKDQKESDDNNALKDYNEETVKGAWSLLSQLFVTLKDDAAKFFKDKGFQDSKADFIATKNLTSKSGVSKVPKVHPVGDCVGSERCKEINTNAISINGKYDQNVILTNSPAYVETKFFAYADKDQMPIKQITVDWNDDTTAVKLGGPNSFYRNRRGTVNGQCATSINFEGKKCVAPLFDMEKTDRFFSDMSVAVVGGKQLYDLHAWNEVNCDTDKDCQNLYQCQSNDFASNFGHVLSRSCDNSYYNFGHYYICDKNSDKYDPTCSVATEKEKQYFSDGCCVFQPKVQVLDNWGWCNGKCPGGADGTDGCYNGKDNNGKPIFECSNFISNNPYTSFGSKVLVAPNNSVVNNLTF
ncbi:MAG: hypothetical protein WCT11_01665 [Candidatus Magasanikbacteria bacterium]